jgi:hypothetical protein
MAENSTKANTIAKILFIIGGVLLFVLLAIFILRMVPVAISNISNFGSSIGNNIKGLFGGEQIAVTADSESVTSGTPVVFNFEYAPEVPGQYYVSYSCADGLFFDIQSNNGPKRIVCDTPFKLGENLSAISIVPILTKANTFADATVTISFKDPEGNPVAEGTTIVTITNQSADGTPTATSTNPFDVNGSTDSNGSSKPDVTSTPVASKPAPTTSTGTSRPSTGSTSYVPTYVPRTTDLAITEIAKLGNNSGFVLYVYNLGNVSTGQWYFSYTDAQNPSQTLISPAQGSLGAGQGMAVTVQFAGQKNSSQNISVHVDPYGYIAESNESNNYASVIITGNRTGGSTGDNSYDSNDDADLVITRLEVGRLSGSRFVEEDDIDEDDTAAVRFIVKNQGGESTGSWKFEITNLPYDSGDTYRSKSYSSLQPGQSIEIIADFEGIDDGRYNIRVEADSEDDVDEESESNNTESETLEVNR